MISEEDIPAHWSVNTLGGISTDVINGGTPKRSDDSYWGGEIPWLSSSEVRGMETDSAEETITEHALAESSAKLFPKDSVLVAMYGGDGTNGRTTILREEMSGNQAICCLIIDENICTLEYVWYYLQLARDELSAKARGGVQQNLNQSLIKTFSIPIPPLSEQERIVSVLDDAFESLDRVEDLSTDVSDYADEFIDAFLHEIFSSDNISEKWPTSLVSDVTEINPRMKLPENKRHPYVPMDAINPETSVIERFDVREDIYSGLSKFKEGDIVVARITPCFENGNIAIVQEIPEGEYAVGSSELVVFRPKNIDPHYLFYYLNSPSVKDWGKRRLSGATGRERVKVSQFRTELSIPVPPTEKQESIVSILDSVTRNTRRTDGDSSRITDYAVELRRSLLQQAFTGQLLRD